MISDKKLVGRITVLSRKIGTITTTRVTKIR